jgi:chemotaxis protein MotB
MSHARSRRGGGHEEEHENHERWAVSYADMMTVLMALFLVLFAMSSIDVKKYDQLRTSLAKGFGNEALPTSGGSGIVDGSTQDPVDMSADSSPVVLSQSSSNGSSTAATSTSVAGPAAGTGAGDQLAARVEAAHLEEIKDQVDGALAAKDLSDAVRTTITERGLEITVVANDIFFKNASAEIQPRGYAVLDALGPTLAGLHEQVSVEGHANTLALSGGPYASNWELSGARAFSVLRRLTDVDGVAGSRLQATGFGDAHPLYPVDDPRAVEGNRRVDIVVLSDAAPEVRALVPALVGSATTGTAAPSGPAAPATDAHPAFEGITP